MATELADVEMTKLANEEEPLRVFKSKAEVRAWLGLSAEIEPLPEWQWVRNDKWQRLEGFLSDHPDHDTTEMKRRNRLEEEEHDARKFA